MEKRVLGDYTLLKELGKGSLGTTYLAEHRFIKKLFALKILPEALSKDESFIQRFEGFVASLASINHPYIAKLHNVSFSDGIYYVVSDFIGNDRGESLNLGQYLQSKRAPLQESEILDFLEMIADALTTGYQHKVSGHPVVHGNMKLNNILVKETDSRPTPLLSDFGIASVIGEASILTTLYRNLAEECHTDAHGRAQDTQGLSRFHYSFYQTYSFLAPEQRFMREGVLSKQMDTYAFGVLSYFLIHKVLPEGAFPLPSSIRSDFTLDWDTFIKELLNPVPQKRASSISDAIDRLKMSGSQRAPEQPVYKKPPQERFAESRPHVYPYNPESKPKQRDPQTDLFTQPYQQTAVMQEVKPDREMIQTVSKMAQPEAPKPVLKPQEIERPTYEPDPGKVFQVDSTVAPYRPEKVTAENIEPILTDMSVIKGGEFHCGSERGIRDERPIHTVWLSDFALDIHPVTNEQFVRFLKAMGGEKDSNNNDIIRLRDARIKKHGGEYHIEAGYAKHPVIAVTWYGASAYAKWVGKRLPTEAEFEAAAQGALSQAIFPTGDDIDRGQANYFGADTTAVMSYPANGYGLYDMAGNVYEWCNDWYGYNYYEEALQEPHDPKGPLQGVYRVLRGGCWKSLKEDLRTSHRHRNNPATINTTYGFRCAANVT